MLGFYIFIEYNKGIFMKTIKESKLRELLSSKGVDEGFIDRILKRAKLAKSKGQMKDLDNRLDKLEKDADYQKLVKKYDLEDFKF
ncbi:MAG TPA: hypothetical protein DEG69_19080 [Flavobacteriaceae bacterium]|nr:hypothetical protein [Flavobacteriaceae bacterium]